MRIATLQHYNRVSSRALEFYMKFDLFQLFLYFTRIFLDLHIYTLRIS